MLLPRTFGVEWEFASKPIVSRFGVDDMRPHVNKWCYHSKTGEMKYFFLNRSWKAKVDGSCGLEINSPPLCDTVSLRSELTNLFACMKENSQGNTDSAIFDKCGLHVHVGASDYTQSDERNLFRLARYFDRPIFSLMHSARHNNTYTQNMRMSDVGMNLLIESGNTKYCGLNTRPLVHYGTVEFRYARSTFDVSYIEALVVLYASMVEWNKSEGARKLGFKGSVEAKRQYMYRLFNLPTHISNVLECAANNFMRDRNESRMGAV